MEKFEFTPIGVVRTTEKYRFEQPRQGIFSRSCGWIELAPAYGGDALRDLAGFERIWVIFCFHLNYGKGWKARVHPPLAPEKRPYSIFSTRSPHRPNAIGMSCVELVEIRGNRLMLGSIDMVDNTPVLDIKPYIPEADAFPGAAAGWRDQLQEQEYKIDFTAEFIAKAEFLLACGAPDMQNVAQVQLTHTPFDRRRKRLYPGREAGTWELGCRTWRIAFCEVVPGRVRVKELYSNYTAAELLPESGDPYQDKELHRKFIARFYPDGAENT